MRHRSTRHAARPAAIARPTGWGAVAGAPAAGVDVARRSPHRHVRALAAVPLRASCAAPRPAPAAHCPDGRRRARWPRSRLRPAGTRRGCCAATHPRPAKHRHAGPADAGAARSAPQGVQRRVRLPAPVPERPARRRAGPVHRPVQPFRTRSAPPAGRTSLAGPTPAAVRWPPHAPSHGFARTATEGPGAPACRSPCPPAHARRLRRDRTGPPS